MIQKQKRGGGENSTTWMVGAETPLRGEDRDQENKLPLKKTKTHTADHSWDYSDQDPEIVTGLVFNKCFEKSKTKVLTEPFIK